MVTRGEAKVFSRKSFSPKSFSAKSIRFEILGVTPQPIVLGGGGGTRILTQNHIRIDTEDDKEAIRIVCEIIASGVIYELGRLSPQVTLL